MVLSRLEADATKTREAADAEQQKEAATEAAVRARELGTAQELETRATERCVFRCSVCVRVNACGSLAVFVCVCVFKYDCAT